MSSLARQSSLSSNMMWVAVALAAVASLSYVLMKAGLLGIGNLHMAADETFIIDVAAGGYLLGSVLILLRRRWLWIAGAVINGLVIASFVSLYTQRPDVLFSPGGLISKVAQLALEVALLALIVTWRPKVCRAQLSG